MIYLLFFDNFYIYVHEEYWSESSHCDPGERNQTSIHEDPGSIPGIAVNCGVGHRLGLDPALLWLWYRPAAIAPIWPLAWEFRYTEGTALKRKKKKIALYIFFSFFCSFFFFVLSLFFLIRVMLVSWVGEYTLFCFLENIMWNWCYFFFKWPVEFTSKIVWTIFNYIFNLFNSYTTNQVIFFILAEFW